MANDAINPFQQFFTFAGLPNANGQIEFFTDSGKLTQKDIFSDSALTVAQSNPYTLDDSGRIRGDVHYDGLATLVHTNVNAFEFRQDDEVVVSGSGAAVTIQEESIVSMRANQTLVVGNIVRTRGYFAGTFCGGARYIIVAARSGTIDAYLFHSLGNGLQAQLIDLERNKSFLVAGARGDGGNDTEAMQTVIALGGDLKVEGGFTFVASNLEISINIGFIGSGAIQQRSGASGDLFQIAAGVTSVKFRDVILDGNQPNVDENNATVGWVV